MRLPPAIPPPVLTITMAGFVATVVQIILLRQFLVLFYGNEPSAGSILSGLLPWSALGSGLAGRWAQKVPSARQLAGTDAGCSFNHPPSAGGIYTCIQDLQCASCRRIAFHRADAPDFRSRERSVFPLTGPLFGICRAIPRQQVNGQPLGIHSREALRARSIIGDVRSPTMQEKVNRKIKPPESFRPFAPLVLNEHIFEYFEIDRESPCMLPVAQVAAKNRNKPTEGQQRLTGLEKLKVARSELPAVTHVDFSARIQSVDAGANSDYHRLIAAFYRKYSCAVVINTSFNVRGEPIVCSSQDAYRCFMRTDMDYLVMGNYLLDKSKQKALASDVDWRREFELD